MKSYASPQASALQHDTMRPRGIVHQDNRQSTVQAKALQSAISGAVVQRTGPFGNMSSLPGGVGSNIMSYLSQHDLSRLAATNRANRESVNQHNNTQVPLAVQNLPREVERYNIWQYNARQVEGMSDEQFKEYQESSKKHMTERSNRPDAKLKKGAYLYHGTTGTVASIAAASGLGTAEPEYRDKKNKYWDASKDGFLSMAPKESGAYLAPKGVRLRSQIGEGDMNTNQWKSVGGPGAEVVSAQGIPSNKLEYFDNQKRIYRKMYEYPRQSVDNYDEIPKNIHPLSVSLDPPNTPVTAYTPPGTPTGESATQHTTIFTEHLQSRLNALASSSSDSNSIVAPKPVQHPMSSVHAAISPSDFHASISQMLNDLNKINMKK